MESSLNLIADSTIKGRIYPALARHQARPYTPSWRQFGQHWPYTTPLRVQEYCTQHGVDINIYSIDSDLPEVCYYPICLGFFDFEIDYFGLLPEPVMYKLTQNRIKILFFYHEGDNPARIRVRLENLCQQHGLKTNCYIFVSANSAADRLPGFVTFHDFELWYYQRNLHSPALAVHNQAREKEFSVLNRLHKSWRAAALADLQSQGILDRSYWSYCERPEEYNLDDCPIEVDMISQLRYNTKKFLDGAPYFSDELSDEERNNHSVLEPKYFVNAYFHIVLESQFDVDQSNGAFVTEKTFKPIKHGQPFFVAGGAGSLQVLRDLGYQVFDDVLDNSYDLEHNHTMRWIKLTQSIALAKEQGVAELFERCRADVEHNQQLFLASKADRLNSLTRKIHEQYS